MSLSAVFNCVETLSWSLPSRLCSPQTVGHVPLGETPTLLRWRMTRPPPHEVALCAGDCDYNYYRRRYEHPARRKIILTSNSRVIEVLMVLRLGAVLSVSQEKPLIITCTVPLPRLWACGSSRLGKRVDPLQSGWPASLRTPWTAINPTDIGAQSTHTQTHRHTHTHTHIHRKQRNTYVHEQNHTCA